MEPKRKILTPEQLTQFLDSNDFKEYVDFIKISSMAVEGKKLTDLFELSLVEKQIVELLDNVEKLIEKAPPLEHDSRFGNPQFKLFFDLIGVNVQEWLIFIPSEHREELGKYLCMCFGNRQRIDYGTGHETNFFVFLYGCYKLNLITDKNLDSMVLVVFKKYLDVMRVIQMAYLLEPAGSHGLWGLDDYSMLPFLFGAAQLRGHKFIKPKSIHDKETVDFYSKDFLYLGCIQFINEIKSVSLKWHSPMLNDISGVKKWDKVHEGMIKMYTGEVLSKLPVMQHFMFGSFITFNGPSVEDDKAYDGHSHVYGMGQVFPDCCGMRIPSSIAASGLAYKNKKDLPFD